MSDKNRVVVGTVKIDRKTGNVIEPEAQSSLSPATGSTAELIASKELLRRWLKKYAPGNIPGAWEYDHDAVELIETTAKLIGIEHPWRQ